jgi:hypothetical protein
MVVPVHPPNSGGPDVVVIHQDHEDHIPLSALSYYTASACQSRARVGRLLPLPLERRPATLPDLSSYKDFCAVCQIVESQSLFVEGQWRVQFADLASILVALRHTPVSLDPWLLCDTIADNMNIILHRSFSSIFTEIGTERASQILGRAALNDSHFLEFLHRDGPAARPFLDFLKPSPIHVTDRKFLETWSETGHFVDDDDCDYFEGSETVSCD